MNKIKGLKDFLKAGNPAYWQLAALATDAVYYPGLFANGEQGVWYDPNDLTTLFQDSTGTTPVTAAGQPVGLMLDKSKGLVRGSELVANGDFSSGNAGWTVGAGWSISSNQASVLSSGVTDSSTLVQNIAGLSAGKLYILSFQFHGRVTGGLNIRMWVGATPVMVATTGSSGNVLVYINATSVPTHISISNVGITQMSIDNISIRELSGNHAFQSTAASRPTYQVNGTTGARYISFDGSDDFLVTNSINFTTTDKVTVFAGARKLSDAAQAALVELSTSSDVNNGTFLLDAPNSAGLAGYRFFTRGTLSSSAAVSTGYAAPISNVLTAVGSIGGDSATLRANGVQVASSTADQGTGNYGNYPLYIGRRGGTTLPFNGHLYGLTIVGKIVSDSEIKAVEKDIAKKVGVTIPV